MSSSLSQMLIVFESASKKSKFMWYTLQVAILLS